MAAPLVPSPLDYIGRRRFAFYPAIGNILANEWMLGSGSWSEVQIVNAHTGSELWVPRVYIGAVSEQADSLVVGLTQRLEMRAGRVEPCRRRRVIEMQPPQPSFCRESRKRVGLAPVIGIRLEKPPQSAFHKTPVRLGIFVLFVAGLMALVAAASRI